MKRFAVLLALSLTGCLNSSSPTEPNTYLAPTPTPTPTPSAKAFVYGVVSTTNDANAQTIRGATIVFKSGTDTTWAPITLQTPDGYWNVIVPAGVAVATASAPGYETGSVSFAAPGPFVRIVLKAVSK
jgi:hypothetical protein